METKIFGVLGLLLCMVPFICGYDQGPRIVNLSKNLVRGIGGTAEFSCSVKDNYDFPVLWLKDSTAEMKDPILLSVSSTLNVKDARLTLQSNSTTYTIKLTNLKETDAGYYQCKIETQLNKKVTGQVHLQVHGMVPNSSVILDNITRSYFIMEGESTSLQCYAEDNPTTSIVWTKANSENLPAPNYGLTYRGNILQITPVDREDRGTYYCNTENGGVHASQHSIVLEVGSAPVIFVREYYHGQALTYDKKLVCRIDGFPAPQIVWLRNGIQIYSNEHYRISEHIISDEIIDATLLLVSVTSRQYGDYMCRATNGYGSAEALLHFYETPRPNMDHK